jgi:S-adenosylmethionine:tRNA ribosyltransferase-isomerase
VWPTASLHFTPELMERLAARGVGHTFLTLHVGLGTFAPVKVEDTADHRMHEEWYEVPEAAAAAVAATRAAGGSVVAVGTTVARALESAAAEDGTVRPGAGRTRLFVTPGYRFRAVDRLLTNFHLPRSTLLMLVAAFAGLERTRAAYAHAVGRGFRFFSYGDACLLDRAAEGPA